MLNRRELLGVTGAGIATGLLPAACSSKGPATTPTSSPPAPPASTVVPGAPDTDTMMGWIRDMVDFGIRRPGHPGDNRTVDWIVERFGELGLDNVRREPFATNRFTNGDATLEVIHSGETDRLECYPVAYTAPADGLTATLARHDPDDPATMAGHAVFRSFEMTRIPAKTMTMLGSVDGEQPWQERVVDVHDTLEDDTIVSWFEDPMKPVDSATAAGAVAFIGVWRNQPGDTCNHYMPYQGAPQPIPGVWIRPTDGQRLEEWLDEGEVTIHLTMATATEKVTTHLVVGELAGADDHTVVIGSHHDGPWASAVEDASGIALVLAQAAHWASIPPQRRPHRLVFLAQGGHFANLSKGWVDLHEDELDDVVLEVHAEHVGRAVRIPETPTDTVHDPLEVLDTPFPRWWFVSPVAQLRSSVLDIIGDEQIDRSLIVAPDAVGDFPPTDAAGFFIREIPCVSLLAAPDYIFDKTDTLDKVHEPSLVPITRALTRIVEDTAGVTPAAMRRPATDW